MTMKKTLIAFVFVLCVAAQVRSQDRDPATGAYVLKPSPKTVVWGYYSASAAPVLKVKSGDTVQVQTLITSSPDRLERAGTPPEKVEQSLRDITREVTDKGPGGHILTGPIYIEGAEPGDVLEVRIKSIKLALPYAYTAFRPGAGFLTDDFTHSRTKIIPLDEKRMVGRFGDGVEIPLRPFFGCMGVAPPKGRVSSGPPGVHAGNLDNKELVAGTKLFIPVHVRGALFAVGDGHAAQGNGEVNITALETSLHGTFQFVVREAIDFLVTEKGLSPNDAYMLTSVAVDFCITQVVDGTLGVHGMIPKA